MNRTWVEPLAIFVLALGFIPIGVAQPATQQPRRQLDQLVQQLQSDPGNQELRKQIIQLANTSNPKPGVSEEANELIGEAQAAIKVAKDNSAKSDYGDAVRALKEASLLAPWSGDVYYNLGVAEELAGQLNDAVSNFRLYLLAEPGANDAAQVEQRIGADNYTANNASRAPTEFSTAAAQPAPETEEQKDADFIRRLDGAEYRTSGRDDFNCLGTVRIDGNSLSKLNDCYGRNGGEQKYHYRPSPIAGRHAVQELTRIQDNSCPPGSEGVRVVYTIFDDRVVSHMVAENGGQAMWDARNLHGGGTSCIPRPDYTYYRIR